MSASCFVLTVLAALLVYYVSAAAADDTEDVGFHIFDTPATVPEMIRKNGYPCEEHTVITEDKYILTIHRIKHGKKSNSWFHSSPPVLFQHGLLSSSASWVLNTPDKAPAYVYADRGYDVWLTNIRGNRYSKKHVTLDASSKEFWQFSWDDMARYDVPAFIDYILAQTGYSQLYYMGHSMGTTIFFAGLSLRPEYNEKVKLGVMLAPVGTVAHIRTPLRFISYAETEIMVTMDIAGQYELLPDDAFYVEMFRPLCDMFRVTEFVCSNLLFLITGFDNHELNNTMFPMITKEMLSGTSIYTVVQFGQNYRSGTFQWYDYGYIRNMFHYGSFWAPEYDMSKVTAPVILMYGENDYLADPEDVKFLTKNLPNVRGTWKVDYANFNHLDFLWAIDVYRLVYEPVLKFMGNF